MKDRTIFLMAFAIACLLCYFGIKEYQEAHRFDLYCNIMEYGAKGDGVTDDLASIQKALDECESKYGVYIPRRKHGYLILNTIHITNNCRITGSGLKSILIAGNSEMTIIHIAPTVSGTINYLSIYGGRIALRIN